MSLGWITIILVLKNCFWEQFSILQNQKTEKRIWQSKIIFYFMFLKTENMMFSDNIFFSLAFWAV